MMDIGPMLKEQMLKNLINNNPQYQTVMNEIKESGLTPQELFYKKAKEMGVDPNSITSLFK